MRSNPNLDVQTGHHRTAPLGNTEAKELVDQARRDGFESPAYLTLRDHLWQYAMPVVKDALRTGKMPRLLIKHNVIQPISAADKLALHTSPESRDELTVDIIVAGELHLQTVITKNRWKPEEGASIETFFVTGCLFQFQTVYRQWSKTRTDHHAKLDGLTPEPFARIASKADPASAAVNSEMARIVLREADPTTRAILSLLATDHTYAEVGQALGFSAKAVEGRVYRFKQLIRRRLGDTPTRPRARSERAA